MDNTLPLRDIHLPEPVSWWPPAPGWWLLLLLVLLILASLWLWQKMYQRKQLHRDALSELNHIRQQYKNHGNKIQLVQSLSVFLRRACISFYPRQNAASLTGTDWLNYLDQSAQQTEFTQGVGRVFADAPYLPHTSEANFDANALLMLCETWLQSQSHKGKS